MIYLDYAATTPISGQALQVYNEVSKNYFGNTSSLHDTGTTASTLLEQCRIELSNLLHTSSKGIFFTSGGTESNILAIKALLSANKDKGNHIITTVVEHSSLANYFLELERDYGYSISYLDINCYGEVELDQLATMIQDNTVLVSIQHGNSETGAVQAIEKIGQFLEGKGILFHSDCVQTFGKLPIDLTKWNIDAISLSSHKIYGPKGVGALYINPDLQWSIEFTNKNHERGLRPGTINVPGIAAFVTAAQEVHEQLISEHTRFLQLRNSLISGLEDRNLNVEIISCSNQLPNIIGMLLGDVQGDYAMLEFNRAGIAISTGSACSIGQQQPSKTMLALGKSEERAKRFIRLSFGKGTNNSDIDRVLHVCSQILQQFEKKGFKYNE